jgi:hypothetical protein
MIRPCSENDRKKITQKSIEVDAEKISRIPSIFNDERTESFICLRWHIYMSHV